MSCLGHQLGEGSVEGDSGTSHNNSDEGEGSLGGALAGRRAGWTARAEVVGLELAVVAVGAVLACRGCFLGGFDLGTGWDNFHFRMLNLRDQGFDFLSLRCLAAVGSKGVPVAALAKAAFAIS